MRNDEQPEASSQPIRLSEYRPPSHLIEKTSLIFSLHPEKTHVRSVIDFYPNPESSAAADRLWLDGEGLNRLSAYVDGIEARIEEGVGGIWVEVPARSFRWEAEVEINPSANTALEGLYISNGMYCTQCEAEGFRRITYYPDRPDVMAPFEVEINADLPVLLSNGNLVSQESGKARWFDPWPKPSYLFALVAGELHALKDQFTTRSGKEIALAIWVRDGDQPNASFALEALKTSMAWDEEAYGREYDLDCFNIVAVDDFNMGAMENKGLNIFNSRYVLASPETATDRDYELIEAIIAHEYFHNWTGNRITCRDWFQLCLKEGLTVYRDQHFSGDIRGHELKRIRDVAMLRARQFREDAGPLSHPVRPESYREINNFYTATVYEKGAELVRMLRLILGEENWAAGLEYYFSENDGRAATIEDWLASFSKASGKDLKPFKRWYQQSGTPVLSLSSEWSAGELRISLSQRTAPTADQAEKGPLPIPFSFGLLSAATGNELSATQTLLLEEEAQEFVIPCVEPPIISPLRGFSAPVVLDFSQSKEALHMLLAHDRDGFVRAEAARALASDALLHMIENASERPASELLEAYQAALSDESLNPALRAFIIVPPSEDELATDSAKRFGYADPERIFTAREGFMKALAHQLGAVAEELLKKYYVSESYAPTPAQVEARSLWMAALTLEARRNGPARAQQAFSEARDMTTSLGALAILLRHGAGALELQKFEKKWHENQLVMDKWFMMQISAAKPESTVHEAERLTRHSAFNALNPNRVRSVFGALTANHAGFHIQDGSGYRLLAEWLLRFDRQNPQLAARLSTTFETAPRYDSERQAKIYAEIEKLRSAPSISRNLSEMLDRILAGRK